MFGSSWRQHIEERQDRIETSVNHLSGNVSTLASDVGNLRSDVGAFSGKLDKLFDTIAGTAESGAERAAAVKTELREDADRKAKGRSSMIQVGLAILGAAIGMLSFVAVLIAALTGPWKERVETTATGQQADTAAIAAVREVLAQQGAGIGRNYDSIEIGREKNKLQDEQLRQIEHDDAFMQGWMGARYGYPGH